MLLSGLGGVVAMGSPPGQGQGGAPAWMNIVPLLLLVVVFYVALIRPQQKKEKDRQAMLKTVQKGDKILTNGGILAEVITVRQESLMVRSADSKFEIAKSAVAQITERTDSGNGAEKS